MAGACAGAPAAGMEHCTTGGRGVDAAPCMVWRRALYAVREPAWVLSQGIPHVWAPQPMSCPRTLCSQQPSDSNAWSEEHFCGLLEVFGVSILQPFWRTEGKTVGKPSLMGRTEAHALLKGACTPLQVGQFLGARADFIPEPICRRLSVLQDQVHPRRMLLAPPPPLDAIYLMIGRRGFSLASGSV